MSSSIARARRAPPVSRVAASRATLSAALAAVLMTGCAISPTPLSVTESQVFGADKLARVDAEQEPVGAPIDLHEAMARALKYNLDTRVEEMQRDLKMRELDLASFKMLPNLVGNSSFASRDNDAGSTSISLLTRRQSLEPSTSQERRLLASDLQFSWNILDFGLSYVRAQQAADDALIAAEIRRKVIARSLEDVRTAYWRAVGSERMVARLRQLEARVRNAQVNSRKLYDDGQTSPITAITYERELVEIKRETQRLDGELRVAKAQLAALINLRPGTPFRLVHKPHGTEPDPLRLTPDAMIEIALTSRPEMAEVNYKTRINAHEARAALLELLPGAQMYFGANADSNAFLAHHDWVSWGAKASWNLMRVFQYPARSAAVEAQDRLLDQRALAVTMAIMTQVTVSRARYQHSLKELRTAREYFEVQTRLIKQMRAQADADKISEQTLIREEMNTIVAEVKRDIAYATMQNAFGAVYSAMGLDAIGSPLDLNGDVASVAQILRTSWGRNLPAEPGHPAPAALATASVRPAAGAKPRPTAETAQPASWQPTLALPPRK